jgi:hydroxypyruvate isomerase
LTTSPICSAFSDNDAPTGLAGNTVLISVHLDYVLGAIPFEERFATARSLGFTAVEFPFPYAVPAGHYARLLADNGLSQISLGAPTSDYKAGVPGYSVTPDLKPLFDESIGAAIDYAQEIGCRRVHLFAGPRAADVPAALAFDTYCKNLAEAHDRLEQAGLELVIEPVNSTDFAGYFLDRIDMAAIAIDRADRPGIGLILDVYHASVNHEDPVAFLRSGRPRVSHIQLADFPGRHEPGTGSIDFAALFQALAETGYEGTVGLEYIPTRSILEGIPLAAELGLPASPYTT